MRKMVIGSSTPAAPAVTAHGAQGRVVQRFRGEDDLSKRPITERSRSTVRALAFREASLPCSSTMLCKMVRLNRRQRLHNAY